MASAIPRHRLELLKLPVVFFEYCRRSAEKLPEWRARLTADRTGQVRPVCQTCHRPLILRRIGYGPDAGRQVWDCANFPKCLHSVESGSDAAVAALPPA